MSPADPPACHPVGTTAVVLSMLCLPIAVGLPGSLEHTPVVCLALTHVPTDQSAPSIRPALVPVNCLADSTHSLDPLPFLGLQHALFHCRFPYVKCLADNMHSLDHKADECAKGQSWDAAQISGCANGAWTCGGCWGCRLAGGQSWGGACISAWAINASLREVKAAGVGACCKGYTCLAVVSCPLISARLQPAAPAASTVAI